LAEQLGSIIAVLVLIAAVLVIVKQAYARISGKRSSGCAGCTMSGKCTMETKNLTSFTKKGYPKTAANIQAKCVK
jgi:hypothetical protein